jgi:hypothetical protein
MSPSARRKYKTRFGTVEQRLDWCFAIHGKVQELAVTSRMRHFKISREEAVLLVEEFYQRQFQDKLEAIRAMARNLPC